MFPWGAISIDEIFNSPRALAFLRYAQSQLLLGRKLPLLRLLGVADHKTKGDYR